MRNKFPEGQVSLTSTRIDPTEAPEGFYAVNKNYIQSKENVCNFCDIRSVCIKESQPCMSYQRKDQIGVYFKRKGA